MSTRSNTAAQAARVKTGLTIEEAARRARVSPRYLAVVERHGAPFSLAERLAAIYRCPISTFLPRKGGGAPKGDGTGPSRARSRRGFGREHAEYSRDDRDKSEPRIEDTRTRQAPGAPTDGLPITRHPPKGHWPRRVVASPAGIFAAFQSAGTCPSRRPCPNGHSRRIDCTLHWRTGGHSGPP
jgi:transcriptional regulator with XRE-family HTH domain